MKTRVLVAATGILCAFTLFGCTKEARQDVGEAGQNVGQATEKSAEATGEVVGGAAKEAGENVEQAGEAVAGGVQKAGEAIENTAENAGEAIGGAVQGAAKETQDAAQSATLTPTVKNALVADKSINASTIDVDTTGERDTVILKGTVRSAAEKKRAGDVAQRALTNAKSNFKIKNNLTVATP